MASKVKANRNSSFSRPKVLLVWGTRPEAVKMAPVVLALRREPRLRAQTCVTAQHRGMLDQALAALQIRPDYDLDLMRPNQELEDTTARILDGVSKLLRREPADIVLVQGDTTTAFAAALAAFYCRIPVGHIEAGLRTHDKAQPFPEEANRLLTGQLSTLHFAPTSLARANLVKEGIAKSAIFVTGNTIVDALKCVRVSQNGSSHGVSADRQRLLLVTAHRRESFGRPFEGICRALLTLAERHADLKILYPVHPNPNVRETAHRMLRHDRISLVEPMSYPDLLGSMSRAELVLTDSGGIQEEAPSFGKPVVVLRSVTERPEAAMAGAAVIAGTEEKAIVGAAERILTDSRVRARMSSVPNPFGDGRASARITRALLHHFKLGPRPADWRG